MKFFNLVLLVGITSPIFSAGLEDELPIEAHLHRIMARHELTPEKFTYKDVSWCTNTLFMNAEEEGNLSKMSAIIRFFKDEDIVPADLREWREKLFKKTTVNSLRYSHIRSAF